MCGDDEVPCEDEYSWEMLFRRRTAGELERFPPSFGDHELDPDCARISLVLENMLQALFSMTRPLQILHPSFGSPTSNAEPIGTDLQ